MHNDQVWQTKLAARIHDPAEKALVLLRDPAGHEGGTSKALTRLLGFGDIAAENIDPDNDEVLSTVLFKRGIPRGMYRHVQRADWWAAAADRPQWPMQEITITTKSGERKTLKVADWAQVRWAQSPVLIHPLTGDRFDLGQHGGLADTDIEDIKQRSFEHFSRIVEALSKQGTARDWKKILLAFWRFGPELSEDEDFGKLGELWRMLPADTRVPDHSIWDHLDLTSAFAGAFAGDPEGEAALLALSIGPVQSFITAARSTSDLWAGSHLLSRLAWEAMKPVCDALGPDTILFPRLRGVPQVDLWLRDGCGLPAELFKDCDWSRGGTDTNPLFSAALPNRYVAVVPRSQAEGLARQVETRARQWLQDKGREVVDCLLETAGLKRDDQPRDETIYAYGQMCEQLESFPEVHWAIVPFSLIRPRNVTKQTDLDTTALSEAMAPFFGVESGQPCGFLQTPAWQLLQQEIPLGNGTVFFAPNPGVLYPAVYDLAERVLAAAKAVRPFGKSEQKGWRCSLTGETEWLTTDPEQLKRSYRKQTDTLWAKVAERKPAWAKNGEHLGALPAIKRLWPTLFAEEVKQAVGGDVQRFVVSTHTMTLVRQIDQWLEHGGLTTDDFSKECEQRKLETVALPHGLMRKHGSNSPAVRDAKRLLGLLEAVRDEDDEGEREKIEQLVRKTFARGRPADKDFRLETYYAMLLMDGDHMGRILSGDERSAISYGESFHPQVQTGFDEISVRHDLIRRFGAQRRALSPNRHLAISAALNDFSLTVVHHVVEVEHLGRVIYAGGDDVLAMLPVADLLSAMERLGRAYSGLGAESEVAGTRLKLENGFALLEGFRDGKKRVRLMRMMGAHATASCGAVIAHHQAPLGAVLRELRQAEARAKNEGKRDAFSLTVIKRSGGALHLTGKWGEPVALLSDLRAFLADRGVSRRAVYHSLEWLTDLPEPDGDGAMLQVMLAYQFNRQADKDARARHNVSALARRLTELTVEQPVGRLQWLSNFLSVAEFLAREMRSGDEA